MSELNFENFLIGQPIRDQHGITCCPAIDQETEEKHYIKTLKIPASAVQASGLLLSGAYENAAQVQEYYQSVADALCEEAELLKDLSVCGGFLPYDNWALAANENSVGLTLTMVMPQRSSIAGRQWSQQDALNMGLDLCNALTTCRQKGFIYANLKPENIFADEMGNFCIGDLGFLPMSSLQFTSLPEKYRSEYTAPEVADIYATVSENLDVYALGLILYRIFNDNAMPSELAPPVHADFELWRIISTACHSDPLQRYEDPAQFGQALLAYLQEFGASDTLIGWTETTETPKEEDDTLFLSDAENDAMLADLLASIPEEKEPADDLDKWITEESEESQLEMEQMLAQADDLISHQLPQPVVAPTVIDVQIPQPAVIEPASEEIPEIEPENDPEMDESIDETVCDEPAPETFEPQAEPEDETDDKEEVWDAPKKVNIKGIIITLSVIAVTLALLIGGVIFYYYQFYTKVIDELSLNVKVDSVTVQITTDVDDNLLTVVCSNSYGHTVRVPVQNGQATVTSLNPNTTYTLTLEIDGFHQLTGNVSEIFTTPDNVNVTSFTAVTDVWQGSVLLSIVASGNSDWTVRYHADGEEEKSVSFTGSETSITGLTVGKSYTFILETQNGAPILGTYQTTHVVR